VNIKVFKFPPKGKMTMERRRATRKTIKLKAERLSCTGKCSVFIEDLSETGIKMITAPHKENDFAPGKDLDLELELATGCIISLNCNVRWSYDDPSKEQSSSVGLEIISPPQEYKKFVRAIA
jgi:hypothetical protein